MGKKDHHVEERFRIKTWKETEECLTANELLERIRNDRKSNYDWIASATELVRAITQSDFPEKYANEIKISILSCFADMLLDSFPSRNAPDDYLAVAYCYYTVRGKQGKKAKQLYRKNLIKVITDDYSYRPYSTIGPQYRAWRSEWANSALCNFKKEFGTEIYRWKDKIRQKYSHDVKEATKRGLFKRDKEEELRLISHLADDLID